MPAQCPWDGKGTREPIPGTTTLETSPYVSYWDESKPKVKMSEQRRQKNMSAVRSLQHTRPKTKKRWPLQAHPHTKTKSGSVMVTRMNDKKDKTEMRSVHSLSLDPQHKTLRGQLTEKQVKGPNSSTVRRRAYRVRP